MTLHKLQPDDFSNRETVSQITMFLASIAFLYGASLVQGGPPIWVGDAYNTANMLPGAPESWGFILLVSSTAMIVGMIVGRRWLFLIGLIVTMLWNLFFALSFLREAIHVRTDDIPGAPLGFGAFITYFGISGVFLLLINTYRGKNALSKNQKRSRNPFEIAVVTWLFFYSAAAILFDTFPGAIVNGSTDAYRWYWACLIIGGSVASIIGIFMRPAEDGLVLESIGMFFLGLGLLVYGFFILSNLHASAVFAGGFMVAVGFAAWAESIMIRLDFRKLRKEIQQFRKDPE